MKLERTIFERSYIYFTAFLLFVIAAFWLTYISRIFDQENYRMHLHGIVFFLWCFMLVSQPLLIRQKKQWLHRQVGKLSYVLVPLMLFTTLDLLRYRVTSQPEIDYTFVALVFNALVVFIIFYGLAMYFRHQSVVHARYMVCTVFPFFTPVTDRIIAIYYPSALAYFPLLNGYPNVMLAGFALADCILIFLCIWDWISHRRLNVFPVALIILLFYQYSVNSFYQFEFWRVFCDLLLKW